jgi:hypothetical protein
VAAAVTATPAASHLRIQFLGWISSRPRTYDDVMEAWRTSCPRLSVWEDALSDGLVEYRAGEPKTIVLTSLGRAALDGAATR